MKRSSHKELIDTLKFKYFSKYILNRNPKFSYKEVSMLDGYNSAGVVLKNGKRSLYVRAFESHEDHLVKKTGIHRTRDGRFIMNVKNFDTKDYDKLTEIIDNALKIK